MQKINTSATIINERNVSGRLQVIFELENQAIDWLEPDIKYDLEINEYKSKRSKEQNKKLWALISEIDKQLNGGRPKDPVEVYMQCLEKANAKFEFMLVPSEAIDMLKSQFKAVKTIGTVDVEGVPYSNVQVFYGSSKMNSKEMSDLIDATLDIANELDIMTDYWRGLFYGK